MLTKCSTKKKRECTNYMAMGQATNHPKAMGEHRNSLTILVMGSAFQPPKVHSG